MQQPLLTQCVNMVLDICTEFKYDSLIKSPCRVELEQPCPCLGTIYSLCSMYYIRYRSDVLNRWDFLKTGFCEGIKYALVVRWMFSSATKTFRKSKPMHVQRGAFQQQSSRLFGDECR